MLICVVARGDVINMINMESELTVIRSKSSTKSRKGTQSVSKGSLPAVGGVADENGRKWLHLDYSLGGDTAALSCVAFFFVWRGEVPSIWWKW